jgi:hypothetical protein
LLLPRTGRDGRAPSRGQARSCRWNRLSGTHTRGRATEASARRSSRRAGRAPAVEGGRFVDARSLSRPCRSAPLPEGCCSCSDASAVTSLASSCGSGTAVPSAFRLRVGSASTRLPARTSAEGDVPPCSSDEIAPGGSWRRSGCRGPSRVSPPRIVVSVEKSSDLDPVAWRAAQRFQIEPTANRSVFRRHPWGVSTQFRMQIRVTPRCEQSFWHPTRALCAPPPWREKQRRGAQRAAPSSWTIFDTLARPVGDRPETLQNRPLERVEQTAAPAS